MSTASMQSKYCCYRKENPEIAEHVFIDQKFKISVNKYSIPIVNLHQKAQLIWNTACATMSHFSVIDNLDCIVV